MCAHTFSVRSFSSALLIAFSYHRMCSLSFVVHTHTHTFALRLLLVLLPCFFFFWYHGTVAEALVEGFLFLVPRQSLVLLLGRLFHLSGDSDYMMFTTCVVDCKLFTTCVADAILFATCVSDDMLFTTCVPDAMLFTTCVSDYMRSAP